LECDAPGQKLIWLFTQQLWTLKYDQWPDLNWGLILGSNLIKFKSPQGHIIREKGRLFAVLVSSAWHLIWNLHVNHVIANPDRTLTAAEIYNQWLNTITQGANIDALVIAASDRHATCLHPVLAAALPCLVVNHVMFKNTLTPISR
jgi:hypothetical protein